MAAPRELDGAVVAVVGATGGLGSEIADELTRRGAVVVRAARSGGDAIVDVRDANAGAAVVDAAVAAHGRLDGVVIAAGIVAFGPLAETDDVVIEELFLTNAMGPMWIAKRATAPLRETKGFIANVSGVIADQPMPGMAAYAASKAAAAAAFESLRKELRRDRIDVIDARPPHTETGLATRPLAGTAPAMAEGLSPAATARRIVEGIVGRESVVDAGSF